MQCYKKSVESMKRNRKYYGMSKIEQDTYRYLCSRFSIYDIRFNEIIDDRYPFHVDFYISSIDVFIEINAHHSHGTHRFGTDPSDKQLLEELKKKVEKCPKSQAKNIIRVWTQSDPLKIKTAQDNNLLYIPIWSNKIEVVISEIEQFFKDHNLELPQPTYEYKENELFPNLLKKDAKD